MENETINPKRRFNSQAWMASALVLFYAALMINDYFPEMAHLRFVSARLDCIAFAIGQLIPIGLAINVFYTKSGWLKGLSCCFFPIALIAVILFAFALMIATLPEAKQEAARESGRRLTRSVSAGPLTVRAYHVDGGAACPNTLLIQREQTPFPGVLWMRPLYRANSVSLVNLTVIDPHHVRCVFVPEYRGWPEKAVVLELD